MWPKFQGYFKDEGLDVEVLQMNANVSVAALAAGNVDYNLILQSVVTANLRGLPLKIAGILIERPNHVVVAHPSVQKFADLKNRKIAISSFGSLVDILARLTAAHFQLDPRKDVEFVAAGSSSARVAQLQAGVVQAAFVTPPGNLRAEASGFKTLLRVRDLFPFPVNGIGVTEQKLKTNRDEVKKSSARCCGPIATSSIIRRARSRSYPSGDERNRKWQKMRITTTHRITAEIS